MTAAKHTPRWYSSEHQKVINELADALDELLADIGTCELVHDDIEICRECGWSHFVINRARAASAKAGRG